MSNRLFSDLQPTAGRRFYFALDSIPSVITPAPALLSLQGRQPAAAEPATVFRSPAPAALRIAGLTFSAPSTLVPAPAAISTAGQIPVEVRQRTITPALAAAVENPPTPFVPTLIQIWTLSPGVGVVTLRALQHNVTEGGNIGFVLPGVASLTLQTNPFSLLLLAGGVQSGLVSITGLAPTLKYELTISPEPAVLTAAGQGPVLGHPFIWVDDAPSPASTWITDRAA